MAVKCRTYVRHTRRIDPQTKSFTKAVKDANEWKLKRGLPVAKFDAATQRAYVEYSDGRKEYIVMP